MRKITDAAVNAFMNKTPFSSSNTTVELQAMFTHSGKTFIDAVIMRLHGNVIAIWSKEQGICVTNAGWFSNTTKERLNGLPEVSIYQKKGEWFLNDKKWDGSLVNVAEYGKGVDYLNELKEVLN
jgi:hypothetical protein